MCKMREKGCNHATLVGPCELLVTPLFGLLEKERVTGGANAPIRVVWLHPLSPHDDTHAQHSNIRFRISRQIEMFREGRAVHLWVNENKRCGALVLAKRRFHLAGGFSGLQTVVTILLLFVLICYGATYKRNTDWLTLVGGDISLGSSYWLCLVATIFSIVAMGLGGTAVKKAREYDYR
ncbi:hypothetical protein Y032_0115g473 [Ancylostoma ceylanicum]|uniref:Uncharacterized protein n=1 Tax=Ancylostoma ceylanicum TaxID=53326 RepID=A0A016TBU0_9BILA|nr:hypothetical protein Y032_0115g473 [Ancylostoma ceylanicum]